MVDDLKKQMRRFENLIGFKGKLDVTSRMSMEKLIDALSSKYKKDVQSSLRLHRLEFFNDLVENQRRRRENREEESISKHKTKQVLTDEGEDKIVGEEHLKDKNEGEPKLSDQVVKIDAKDIDDWKDLMTLSRVYYVMEHPRSVGLVWKRRITKKMKIDKFEDMDLIEWRVSQNFRTRSLEEWAQRRSDARRLSEVMGLNFEDSSENSRELDNLFQMIDPSGRRKSKKESNLKEKTSSPGISFKLCDESIEDWTESYSEESECSDFENFAEEIKNLEEEADTESSDSDEQKYATPATDEEDISELIAVYPQFSKHKEPIFQQMDEAKNFEDWLKLYKQAISLFEESKSKEQVAHFEEKLDSIEEEEEGNDKEGILEMRISSDEVTDKQKSQKVEVRDGKSSAEENDLHVEEADIGLKETHLSTDEKNQEVGDEESKIKTDYGIKETETDSQSKDSATSSDVLEQNATDEQTIVTENGNAGEYTTESPQVTISTSNELVEDSTENQNTAGIENSSSQSEEFGEKSFKNGERKEGSSSDWETSHSDNE